jgi:RND family efflux transporter MFP subunit
LVAGILILVIAVAAWWLTRPGTPTVTTVIITRTSGAVERDPVLNASGYVTARLQATVSSKITGKVVEVLVEEGMTVREGQVLARLDDASARSYLRLSEAELTAARGTVHETEVRIKEAELHLGRSRQLVAEGVLGRAELDTAEAEVDSLKARLAQQREQAAVAERQVAVRQTELADTIVRAPFAGVAISKDAQPGEMVSPISAGGGFTRTGICTIVDMRSLEIEVDVNESYINRVTAEQRVTATLDAYPDWSIPASVIAIIPAADRQKATVLVRIGFDALDPRILPDMGVKVAFLETQDATTRAEGPGPILVPMAAVRQQNGQSGVLVVAQDTVERRAVRTGDTMGDRIEILAGLSEGERIVVDGPPDLVDGDRVTFQ